MKAKEKKSVASEIEQLRSSIDRTDNEILELLGERAKLAQAIGEVKRKGSGAAPAFYDPEREQRILDRLGRLAMAGSFPATSVPFVFREIISACRALEAPLKIALLGPEGTYTQIAAQKTFGHSAQYVCYPTIENVFDAVSRGGAEYGVVPVENSVGGGVAQTLDALMKSDLSIRRDMVFRINHCLMSKRESLSGIKKIYSHPQAIAQCRSWLQENLPGVETILSPSTSAAAHCAAEDADSAAIASRRSAELLGLKVLREGIQDTKDNATRFIVLSHEDGPRGGTERTTLCLRVGDPTRELGLILGDFKRAKVLVTRVETRPNAQESWKYAYFVDFAGHRLDPKIARLLKKIARQAEGVKVLGSYPSERFRGE